MKQHEICPKLDTHPVWTPGHRPHRPGPRGPGRRRRGGLRARLRRSPRHRAQRALRSRLRRASRPDRPRPTCQPTTLLRHAVTGTRRGVYPAHHQGSRAPFCIPITSTNDHRVTVNVNLATADIELLGDPYCRRFIMSLWELAGGTIKVTPTVADELVGNVRQSERRHWVSLSRSLPASRRRNRQVASPHRTVENRTKPVSGVLDPRSRRPRRGRRGGEPRRAELPRHLAQRRMGPAPVSRQPRARGTALPAPAADPPGELKTGAPCSRIYILERTSGWGGRTSSAEGRSSLPSSC